MNRFAFHLILLFSALGFFSAVNADEAFRPAPAIETIVQAVNRKGNPLDSLTEEGLPSLRQDRETQAKNILGAIPIEEIRDINVPNSDHQIPIRIYKPFRKVSASDEGLPILVFLHGGGWTLGSISTYDSISRALANKIPAMVISIGYRLAPEYPFPAGLTDAFLATEWVTKNAKSLGGNSRKIGVAGDSAGGNLATVVARRARKSGFPLLFEALFYPSTDIDRTDFASYADYGQGYLLTTKAVETFRKFYLPRNRDWCNPDASPLKSSKSDLALLPPTIIYVAGCDPLRDEGLTYATTLRHIGISVTLHLEKEMVHGFLNFFNSAVSPDASALVEPILDQAAAEIHTAFYDTR